MIPLPLAFVLGLTAPVLPALANEAVVKKTVEPRLKEIFGEGVKIDAVRKTGVLGLYEISSGGDVIYSDNRGQYLFIGDLLDTKAKKNLTEERKNALAQIKFSELPFDLAIKQVKGKGQRVLASFEDPNCGYCKRLAKELQSIDNITLYTFLYPILSPDSTEKAKAIWCSADRVKAWNGYMIDNVVPAATKCDASAVDKTVALGRQLNIRGTPTIFLVDGSRLPGFVPAARLEALLDAAGR